MPIPPEHQYSFAYHFTHLDNLPGILKNGFLCPNSQKQQGLNHHSIAAEGIQLRRSTMAVTCGPGGVVHDYVPFYFCQRSKMLLSVVNAKNVDQLALIYFVVPITLVNRDDVIFTDASANTEVPPKFFQGGDNLNQLNWTAINSKKWSLASDREEQQRMAELLVHKSVDLQLVTEIITWNSSIKKIVQEMFADAKVQCPGIISDSHHYFTKWPQDDTISLVTGPIFTKRAFDGAIKYISETGQKAAARFKNIAALLTGLREDFPCLPETAELVGLESDNGVHHEDAGKHTLSVVSALLASKEFKALNDGDQRLTELAAYLHDIGKGPKSRWAHNNGIQKVDPDHPIGSVEMLRRILTAEIREIKPRSIRVLALLVCYHDLIGDIVAKGRKESQLEAIIQTPRELDMLIALSLADMKAIQPIWVMLNRKKVDALRARMIAKLAQESNGDEE